MPELNVVTFPCRTLTPIWTGDIDRDSGEVKESGILGSLRFWYEGLLRSLGIYVCRDGGRDEDCNCAVCELFGKTGEARKFRLSVDGLERIDLYFQANAEVSGTHEAWLYRTYDGRSLRDFEKGCLWSRGPNGFQMKFHFRVGSRFREYIPMLAALLVEIADKGGIGAKTQQGFGQIELLKRTEMEPLVQYGRKLIKALAAPERQVIYKSGEFTLDEKRFFSLVFEGPLPERYTTAQVANIGGKPLTGSPFVACAFDIRYRDLPDDEDVEYAGLRPTLKERFPVAEVKKMMGQMGYASRIHVSHLYRSGNSGKYRLKIWGDVDEPKEVTRSVIDYVGGAFKKWGLVSRKYADI